MKITIEKVKNGFIISYFEEGTLEPLTPMHILSEKKIVFGGPADEEDNFAEYGAEMFWELLDLLGLGGNRYDRERIQIVTAAGDKYELRKDEELVALDFEYVRMKK